MREENGACSSFFDISDNSPMFSQQSFEIWNLYEALMFIMYFALKSVLSANLEIFENVRWIFLNAGHFVKSF